MKLVILICTFAILFTSDLLAQNDQDWDTKTYDIGAFHDIYLEGGYKVFLTQGDECSLKVKASDEDVFDYLKIKNESGELRIKVDRKHFEYDRISLYITFADLEKIEIEGGMNLKTKGYLNLNDFFMYVKGGAKIELDLKAENIKITGEGGVLIELSGVAESLDVKLSGAGHVDADELKARDVKFGIEGVGTGSVYATETLYAKIEGVGKVKYRGNPKVTKNIDGLGTVKKD